MAHLGRSGEKNDRAQTVGFAIGIEVAIAVAIGPGGVPKPIATPIPTPIPTAAGHFSYITECARLGKQRIKIRPRPFMISYDFFCGCPGLVVIW